jgi:hypothetical protein
VVGVSTDADGHFFAFVWSARDGVAELSPQAAAYAISDPGDIAGEAYYSAYGEYHATVWSVRGTPPAPVSQVQTIAGQVGALVTAGALNQGQGNSLLAKLNAVTAKINQGNTTAAINLLQAFINHCQSLVDSGVLTAAEGESLIDAATALINQLRGT